MMRGFLLTAGFCLCLTALCGAVHAGEPKSSEGAFAQSTQQYDYARGLLARKFYPEAEKEFSDFIKLFPKDSRVPQAIFQRGEARFLQKKFDEAARDYFAVLTKHKASGNQEDARLKYGFCLFRIGRHADAIKTLAPLSGKTASRDAVRQGANYYIGRAYQALGQAEKALAALKGVDGGPEAPLALYTRAEILSGLGKAKEAAALLATFGTTYPKHEMAEQALLRKAENLREAGDFANAAKAYAVLAGREQSPQRERALLGYAWVLYLRGDFAEAEKRAAETTKTASRGDVRMESIYLCGLCQFARKEYKTAGFSFGKVRHGPFAEKALRYSAWAAYHSGNAEQALASAEAFRKSYPDASDEDLDYLQGKALLGQGRFADAVAYLARVRNAKGKHHAQAAYDLAIAYDRLKRNEDAVEAYRYFIKTFPEHGSALEARLGCGRALMALKRFEEALQVFAVVLARDKTPEAIREYALNQQAVCYYWLKQYANMNTSYKQLTEEFPQGKSVPDAIYWMAWYAASEKRYEQAVSFYTRIIEQYPKHKLAPRALYRRGVSRYAAGDKGAAAEDLYRLLGNGGEVQLDTQELLWLGSQLMAEKRFEDAERVYTAVLGRKPDARAKSLAIYHRAESRRRRSLFKEALAEYETLFKDKNAGIRNTSRFGAAVCLRELKQYAKAKKTLESMSLSPEDPLKAHVLFELGLLDLAENRFKQAADHLMRIGLLYDEEQLAGEALLKAGQACLAAGDERKARIAFMELAGGVEQSYGKRYPESKYAKRGREELKKLDDAKKAGGDGKP